jgi:hypothetical protein
MCAASIVKEEALAALAHTPTRYSVGGGFGVRGVSHIPEECLVDWCKRGGV